mmetsp:Transcript_28980/g.78453  ORF Transcript_28980/g.78453 Transcript_28980/m.78453 type:complete len:237 (+) Transcript_28980:2183-2893(+)
MDIWFQSLGELICGLIFRCRRRDLLTDNKWSSGFVNQDGIGFVDYAKAIEFSRSLGKDCLLRCQRQVIPQIIKTKLGVCNINNVVFIRNTTLFFRHFRLDQSNRQTEESMHLSHNFHVTFREVVIHSNHERSLTGQRIEVNRECGYEGFTFSGCHFCKTAIVQYQTTQQLYVVMTQFQYTPCCLTNNGKRFFEKRAVDIFSVLQPLTKGFGFGLEFIVAQVLDGLFQAVDSVNAFL